MKTSFSVSECFSGLLSRESRKTTCPALKPGMMGCPSAAYRAKLRLYIRPQDFPKSSLTLPSRLDWEPVLQQTKHSQTDVLIKIQTEVRSSPTFSGNTPIYT